MLNIKYEPQTFADLIFENEIARKQLERYANCTATGCILLHGPSGTAKSTTARIVANQSRKNASGLVEFPADICIGPDFTLDDLVKIERGL